MELSAEWRTQVNTERGFSTVSALGGVFFRGVVTVITWREHFCKPQKGERQTRTVVGLAFGPGVLPQTPSKQASKREREEGWGRTYPSSPHLVERERERERERESE